ncbi:MAG: hypothetical protein U0871_23475 [Gemmataceae bacterium]
MSTSSRGSAARPWAKVSRCRSHRWAISFGRVSLAGQPGHWRTVRASAAATIRSSASHFATRFWSWVSRSSSRVGDSPAVSGATTAATAFGSSGTAESSFPAAASRRATGRSAARCGTATATRSSGTPSGSRATRSNAVTGD